MDKLGLRDSRYQAIMVVGRRAHSIGKGGGTMQIVIEVVDILEIVPT